MVRIVEAYCSRKVKVSQTPLTKIFKKGPQRMGGSCFVAIAEGDKTVLWLGANAVKIIPISKQDVKALAREQRQHPTIRKLRRR